MDAYTVVGARVRAAITRAHTPSTDAPPATAPAHTEPAVPPAVTFTALPSPATSERRPRKRLAVRLRRLVTLFG
jgi:hypothetical protein